MDVRICTERTRVEPLSLDDAKALYAYRSLPAVYRYHAWNPSDLQEAALFIERHSLRSEGRIGEWQQLGIYSKISGELMGDCGYFRRSPEGVEIGYTIAPDFQCAGLGTEVVTALIRYLFEGIGIVRIHARTDPENTGSIKVLERLGFVRHDMDSKAVSIHADLDDDILYCLERKVS